MNDTPEQRRLMAAEARQVLESPHFKGAFAAVADYIEAKAMQCDPTDKDRAASIVISKQLLKALRRELERKLDDGYMAEVEIAELEKKRGLMRFIR